jgi:S-(hydroxymethyl)glutathione dehydrogenase/alcohol dehydrogenase
MRAAICDAINAPLTVEDVALPRLEDTFVRISLLASGVCHSDLSFIQGKNGSAANFPAVFGHEAVGRVTAVGAGVSRCKVGDIVLGSILPSCGECWHCIRHESQHCEATPAISAAHHYIRRDGSRVLAMAGLGAFSEEIQISEESAVPIRSDLPAEQLALIGCGVTTGVGAALWTAQVAPGSTVAVFGCGGVGQSVIQGAHLAGAGRIIAVDPAALKRSTALALGATDAIDPLTVDPVEALKQSTGGRGVDYAFEVSGIPAVARQAFDSTRKRGTTVMVGMPAAGSELSFPGRSFFYEEKQIKGSLYGSAQAREHLQALVDLTERGRLNLAAMVSRKIGLDDLNEAFIDMQAGDVIRSVIVF